MNSKELEGMINAPWCYASGDISNALRELRNAIKLQKTMSKETK